MRVLCIDDERLALGNLMLKLGKLVDQVDGFTHAEEALAFLKEHAVDAVFLDVNMPEISGLELARKIKELNPRAHIVFVTGYSEYAVEAFRQHASGYVMKPAAMEDLQNELEHIRASAEPSVAARIKVQCFGNFSVMLDGKPFVFSRSKAKELFAYLVFRQGATCSTREMAAILFEDEPFGAAQSNYLQKIITATIKAFEPVGLSESLFRRHYSELSIDATLLDCDYYRFLRWEPTAVNAYTGEFMAQYSWAEPTGAYLDQKLAEKRAEGGAQ